MNPSAATSGPARGVTLLELMIAMAVLSFGLLAMWQLHVIGLTSNSAARRHTSALAIAQELQAGLERLPFDSALLTPAGSAATPPSSFGPLVQWDGSIALPTGIHVWSDGDVPGVRPNADLRVRGEPGTNLERRWLVWSVPATSATSGTTHPASKLILVSVTWNDPGFGRPREVTVYTHVDNASLIRAFAAATEDNAFTQAAREAQGR